MNIVGNREEFFNRAKIGDVFLLCFSGKEKYSYEIIRIEDGWMRRSLNSQDYDNDLYTKDVSNFVFNADEYIHLQSDLFDQDMEKLLS